MSSKSLQHTSDACWVAVTWLHGSHAPCFMLQASRCMLNATCFMRHALCLVLHAPCAVRCASCMRSASYAIFFTCLTKETWQESTYSPVPDLMPALQIWMQALHALKV